LIESYTWDYETTQRLLLLFCTVHTVDAVGGNIPHIYPNEMMSKIVRWYLIFVPEN